MCKFLLRHKIQWIFNTPGASHHCGVTGVWERQIRSIRRILLAVSKGDLFKMDDEQLETLLSLVESIINSRPITHNSDDIRDHEALTPNHLVMDDNSPRSLWPMGRITEVIMGRDNVIM